MTIAVDRDGRLPLHYAAMTNSVPEALARLEAGDDPNLQDRLGFTPLHMAAQQGSVDVARLLLDHGANVDITDVHGDSPLFVAVFNSKGDGALIALLRDRGADPYKANLSGQTPIGLAGLIRNYDVTKFFADAQ